MILSKNLWEAHLVFIGHRLYAFFRKHKEFENRNLNFKKIKIKFELQISIFKMSPKMF